MNSKLKAKEILDYIIALLEVRGQSAEQFFKGRLRKEVEKEIAFMIDTD